jgi:hypothetical protein
MRTAPISRAILLGAMLLANGAAAREPKLRHDRPCDVAQDHPERFTKIWNPAGGNAVMFGGCGQLEDTPGSEWPGRGQWWGALSCGYFAFRENKKRDTNPYSNEHLKEGWKKGWDEATKACKSGKLPFFRSSLTAIRRASSRVIKLAAFRRRALFLDVDLLLHRGPLRGVECARRGDQTCSQAFVDVQHAAEPSRECPMACC